MITALKNIFMKKKLRGPEDFDGVADFILRASDEEKKKVFIEVARRSSEDQMKVYRQAQMMIKAEKSAADSARVK